MSGSGAPAAMAMAIPSSKSGLNALAAHDVGAAGAQGGGLAIGGVSRAQHQGAAAVQVHENREMSHAALYHTVPAT